MKQTTRKSLLVLIRDTLGRMPAGLLGPGLRRGLLVLGATACLGVPIAAASPITVTIPSMDVPKALVEPVPSPVTATSILVAPAIIISDINLILTNVQHTSVPDLHIELWSPTGTHVVLMRAYTEPPSGGILLHTHTPDNFIDVTLDDQAPTSLADGVAADNKSIIPGTYNINHPSVVVNPLSVFNGENSTGTWTLAITDLSAEQHDTGTLTAWSLQINGEPTTPPQGVPEPSTLLLVGSGLGALALGRRA